MILTCNCAKFTLADNERCARMWCILLAVLTAFTKYYKVWEFILLRFFPYRQFYFLRSSWKVFLPVGSFCVTFFYLLNAPWKKIQGLYSLVLQSWCWTVKPLNLQQPKGCSKSAEAAKPHLGLCLSHLNTTVTDPDFIQAFC